MRASPQSWPAGALALVRVRVRVRVGVRVGVRVRVRVRVKVRVEVRVGIRGRVRAQSDLFLLALFGACVRLADVHLQRLGRRAMRTWLGLGLGLGLGWG